MTSLILLDGLHFLTLALLALTVSGATGNDFKYTLKVTHQATLTWSQGCKCGFENLPHYKLLMQYLILCWLYDCVDSCNVMAQRYFNVTVAHLLWQAVPGLCKTGVRQKLNCLQRTRLKQKFHRERKRTENLRLHLHKNKYAYCCQSMSLSSFCERIVCHNKSSSIIQLNGKKIRHWDVSKVIHISF